VNIASGDLASNGSGGVECHWESLQPRDYALDNLKANGVSVPLQGAEFPLQVSLPRQQQPLFRQHLIALCHQLPPLCP
jgi:hypothetical protein